jgi:Sec7-like guanine-nucleotide exchange factor
VRALTRELNAKCKQFLKALDDQYGGESAPDVAAKLLAYSREVKIANVIEVIGGKDERAKRFMSAYLDKMDWRDGSIEHSMRRFLQTFRLAGVDAQVISRIVERFAFKYFEIEPQGLFATREEAFDFAYLIIVLQTSQHNPNIKTKIDLRSFIEQAHMNCPKSKERIPQDFYEKLFHSITDISFFTPVSRSLIEEGYNIFNDTEINIRCSKVEDVTRELTEDEFLNCADLTKRQLFHYSNTTRIPPGNLIPLAVRHLVNFLSSKLIKYQMGAAD